MTRINIWLYIYHCTIYITSVSYIPISNTYININYDHIRKYVDVAYLLNMIEY